MEKSRSKRPPDVNEALSSMLWTPYDQTANTSSSTDSLTDDERQRGERKLNRYSNPLPNSLNWWNSSIPSSHPMTLRYSFPYYGNYLPSHLPNNDDDDDNFASTTTTKRTISTTIDVGNHGQTINTSTFSTTMVHSFTDDFYQYQVIKIFQLRLLLLYVCFHFSEFFVEDFSVYISISCIFVGAKTKFRISTMDDHDESKQTSIRSCLL